MKKLWMYFRLDPGSLKKVWLMSKWTFVFLFILGMNVHANVYSQNEKQVFLSMKRVNLKDVLWEIEKQTSFVFMYNAEDLDRVGKVDISIQTDQVEKILHKCLEGTNLTFSIQDAVIVLKPRQQEQQKKAFVIVGRVTDTKRASLPGATVVVSVEKGGKLVFGTATNPEGSYQLVVPVELTEFFVTFSFMGKKTQVIKYTGQENLNVVLADEEQEIEEVVVTGYANIRKSSFTGNATTVSRDELLKTNNKSVIAALQAFDPSFRIKENTLWGSDPNSLPEFNIRGASSIGMEKGLDVENAKRTQRTNLKDNPNLPIFILDGFEVSVQKIYDMDMNRIASMTILKDAAATAIYGSRAANGVVVVATVAPKPGEMRVSYSMTGGAEFPDLSDYNLCNAAEKLEAEKLMGLFTIEGTTIDRIALQLGKDIEYQNRLRQVERGVNTDWLAQPLRNVFNHKHSLNLQGGAEYVRYGVDFNYDKNGGAMKGSFRDRMGAGLTLDVRTKSWLQIMNSTTYNLTKSENSPYGNYNTYATLQPHNAIYDDKGELLKSLESGAMNPLWVAQNLENFDGRTTDHDLTNNLSVNLFLLQGLQFKGQFSVMKNSSKSESFVDPRDLSFSNVDAKEWGALNRSITESYDWNINAMFYYNKQLNKHFVNASAGFNMKSSYSESSTIGFKGFQLGSLSNPAYAASQPNKTNISSSESRLIGFLAMLNYSYNDVYLLDASVRVDGSSQFGADKRYAPFWSIGGGLNIHNYSWMKDNWLVNTLKVRATYGSTGKVNFPAYAAITTFETDKDAWYYTGAGSGLKYLGNPALIWETTRTLDAGLTIGFLEDRFFVSAAYYHKKTENLVDKVAIQTSSGFKERQSNSGSLLNEGFELNLNTTVYRDENFNVILNANIASNKNRIIELGESSKEYNKTVSDFYQGLLTSNYWNMKSTPLIQYYEGASTSAIYAVRSAGIDPANGKDKFIRKDGTSTYTWDANDQVVVGDQLPDAQGSFGVNLGYHGFYVNASFLYQWGAQIYNQTLVNKVENVDVKNSNIDKRVLLQRWKKVGDVVPYYNISGSPKPNPTSRFVQDYNYLSFSGLSVGYDFKREMLQKFRLASLGLRFNANDLCRWSSVKEERGTSYPYAKNYNFSINVSF